MSGTIESAAGAAMSYITPVRSSALARLVAAALLAVSALAHPGESLAHGVAHEREHEHAGDHAIGRAPDHSTERTTATSGALSSAGHGHDHPHGALDEGNVRSRIDARIAAAAVTLPALTIRLLTVAAPPARPPLARGDPHTGPPPRLRAPPTS